MLSKNRIKYLASLSKKKHRRIEKKFLVEGTRTVFEGLKSSHIPVEIYITENSSELTKKIISLAEEKSVQVVETNKDEISKFCDTKTPQSVAALFEMRENTKVTGNKIVALDCISDPGNLGTIIRTCDWFGVTDIIASVETVDLFNPKVVRSTMGSVFHINYEVAENFVERLTELKKKGFPLFVADASGKDMVKIKSEEQGTVLLLGNEAFGASEQLISIADELIGIKGKGDAESLNVAVAGGILIYELFG